MSEIGVTAFLLVFLITMLASGVWVAFALVITGVAGMLFLSNAPIGSNFATTIWGHSHSWSLAALPMFILMGEYYSDRSFQMICSRVCRPGWVDCREGFYM